MNANPVVVKPLSTTKAHEIMHKKSSINLLKIPLDKVENTKKSKVDIYLIYFLILRCNSMLSLHFIVVIAPPSNS